MQVGEFEVEDFYDLAVLDQSASLCEADLSERGQPLSRKSVYYLVSAAVQGAGLQNVHPHTLRHSCGYHLADKGTDLRTMQGYLGHRDPRHTVHCPRITGRRFEGLWR